MWRTVILASGLALIAGLAGVWLGVRFHEPQSAGASSLHAVVHEELDLTAQQDARIETLEREFAARRAQLEAEMDAARAAIGAALVGDPSLSPEVEAAAERFHAAMGELQLATLRHILAMRAVLDEEQRAVFDNRLERAFGRDDAG